VIKSISLTGRPSVYRYYPKPTGCLHLFCFFLQAPPLFICFPHPFLLSIPYFFSFPYSGFFPAVLPSRRYPIHLMVLCLRPYLESPFPFPFPSSRQLERFRYAGFVLTSIKSDAVMRPPQQDPCLDPLPPRHWHDPPRQFGFLYRIDSALLPLVKCRSRRPLEFLLLCRPVLLPLTSVRVQSNSGFFSSPLSSYPRLECFSFPLSSLLLFLFLMRNPLCPPVTTRPFNNVSSFFH